MKSQKEKMKKKGFKYKSFDDKGKEIEMEVVEVIDLGDGSIAVVGRSIQPVVIEEVKE